MGGRGDDGIVRLMALMLVTAGLILTVVTAAADTPYSRADWPHWTTEACRSTRTRVLVRDSRETAQFTDVDTKCSIAWGFWRDPYTGQVFHDPSKVDVDHLVPLKHAHEHGAAKWSRAKKREYANYMGDRWHLLAVSAAANRAKADRGPDEWLPERQDALCDYVRSWAVVKFIWGLDASALERAKVREIVELHCK